MNLTTHYLEWLAGDDEDKEGCEIRLTMLGTPPHREDDRLWMSWGACDIAVREAPVTVRCAALAKKLIELMFWDDVPFADIRDALDGLDEWKYLIDQVGEFGYMNGYT